MLTPEQRKPRTHRVVLLRVHCGKPEVYLEPKSTGSTLPRVDVDAGERTAPQLISALRADYGIDAVCVSSAEAKAAQPELIVYELVEQHRAAEDLGSERRWIPVDSLVESRFEDPTDLLAVRQAAARSLGSLAERDAGPFARLGWFSHLEHWVEKKVETEGLYLTGRFDQLNACPTFSLIRFETSGPAVWFKAVGSPNLREYPIILTLSKQFPSFVPRLMATREDCNGWLALEAKGEHPTTTSDLRIWKRVVTTLAQMQIASLGNTVDLVAIGCHDARIPALSAVAGSFFEVAAELMEQQTKDTPAPLFGGELEVLHTRLQDIFSRAALVSIPDTIGHLDFNPGNIVASREQCVFLDWAEACVGHPFLTFEFLLERVRRFRAGDRSWDHVLTSTYTSCWQSVLSPKEIAEALDLSSVLAVFAYAARSGRWRDPERRKDPRTAANLRSLVRRMKWEAELLMDKRRYAACLS